MRTFKTFLYAICCVGAFAAIGCNPDRLPDMPQNQGPRVDGTPQERIQRISMDETLTPEEKDRRIKIIKERNNLK